jgi:hypothetical protein
METWPGLGQICVVINLVKELPAGSLAIWL